MSKKKRILKECFMILVMLVLIVPINANASSKIKLNKTNLTLEVGKTATLKLTGSTAKKWSSTDKKVASVSSKGKVKAKKEGTATIKAKATNGKTYKCKVTVKEKEVEKINNSYPDTSNYTKEEKEILDIFETTLRNAGFYKTTDVMTKEEIEEYGPNVGAGWGDMTATLEKAAIEAGYLVEYMTSSGYNTFYIEVVGMSNGVVTLRCYTCIF